MEFIHPNDLPRSSPSSGKLLIAEPFLADPNFSRTVVFLCEFGAEGSMGFVLNKPTSYNLGEILPELSMGNDFTIFQGGPVQMDTLHMIHRLPDQLGGIEIFRDVYWGGSYSELELAMGNDYVNDSVIKLFVGYSGWAAGQLEAEIKQGSWVAVPASAELLFEPNVDELWKKCIRLLGKKYEHLINLPIDPQLN